MVIREKNLISQAEKQRLDEMFGMALIDNRVFERLVYERDPRLFDEFMLSSSIRGLLASVKDQSLPELAKKVHARVSR